MWEKASSHRRNLACHSERFTNTNLASTDQLGTCRITAYTFRSVTASFRVVIVVTHFCCFVASCFIPSWIQALLFAS